MTPYRTLAIDRLKIFHREAGDPALPSLPLLHGAPASSFIYRESIERLAHRLHGIAPSA